MGNPDERGSTPIRGTRLPDIGVACVTWAVGSLPWRTGLRVGGAIGVLARCVLPRKRRRIEDNLDGLVPDPIAGARKACSQLGRTLFEMIWGLSHTTDRVLEQVKIEGLEVLQEAARTGNGVLVVSGHIGNWELAVLALGRSGLPVAIVARRLRSAWLENRFVSARKRAGVHTLVLERSASSLSAYRWLRRGGVLGCLMDRPRDGRKIVVPFLSKQVHISTGPAELACRSGAAVVLVCALREPDDSTVVRFSLLASCAGSDPVGLARRIGRSLEQEVREHPEQWFWIYRRSSAWREPPPPPDVPPPAPVEKKDEADRPAAQIPPMC